jgi:glycosyltransferase involved in cell wall biosynthesis
MIAVVVAEAAPWLDGLLARLVPDRARFVLSPLVPPAQRLAQRVWARGDAARRLHASLWSRRVADRVASHALPANATLVVATSGAAELTFAAARARGVPTMLVQDLPVLRRLHADLDAAVSRHPNAPLLRRFRASAREVARVEAEIVLADRVVVRCAYARSQLLAAGVPEERIVGWREPPAPPARLRAVPRGPRRVLLAGLATTRNGTREVLAALGTRRDVELLVRAGDGLDPADLLARPGVRSATRVESTELRGVQAVVAPAWCESHAPEVELAATCGVPVVATARAAGFVDLGRCGVEVEPGDVEGLGRAIDRVLSR